MTSNSWGEIDRLIATGEARIERQHKYVRSLASDFEGSMRAIADLDEMACTPRAEETAGANSPMGAGANHYRAWARIRRDAVRHLRLMRSICTKSYSTSRPRRRNRRRRPLPDKLCCGDGSCVK